ncbi:hypothetical protein F945_02514 [Acinetobacter rudis CIP 110305]|uniref:TsaA-like domain-containing protein n=2 Tax=Acinetobacter rudis TaxID=632955 RepID=S3MUQ4_9GAMM|nr:hypothetical protein F945_02514 [Acinetobacter rudis CIP 110305]
MMKPCIQVPIIAYMHSPFREKFGIPRQPNLVEVESYLEMQAPYNDLAAFEGIEEFSHLWLIWNFHDNKAVSSNEAAAPSFRAQVRPPRLGGNQKIGVFATRSMYRPAALGLSVVKFKKVVKQGKSVRIYVSGSDLLDGTPIVDIKPYIHYSDAIVDAQSGYAQQQPLTKAVVWRDVSVEQQQGYLAQGLLTPQKIAELEQVLALDPRPAYQQDTTRIYGMMFAEFNIKFNVSDYAVEIVQIEKIVD